jgi:lysozyme family protein
MRHEAGIKAVAAALLTKGSMTGNEAHQIFNRAYWPAAALAMIRE